MRRIWAPSRETWLYRINPSFKLLLFMFLFVAFLFVHNLNVMLIFTLLLALPLALFSGHPGKRLALLGIPFAIVFLSASTTMIFFGKGETTWLKWGLLHITEESFYRGVHLGFRTLNYGLLGLLFALTTRPVLLFYSLMQQLKLPPKVAYSFMASFRLLPILLEEFQTLRHALLVRGAPKRRGLRGFYLKLKGYAIPLLAQSIRRAQRIAIAMEAKRFSQAGLGTRTFYYKTGFSGADAGFAAYMAAASALAIAFGQLYPLLPTDVRHFGGL